MTPAAPRLSRLSAPAIAHLLAAVSWPLIGIVSIAGRAAIRAGAGVDPGARTVQLAIISWLSWGLLAQLIVFLTRRYKPLSSPAHFALHLVSLLLVSLAHSAMYLSLFALMFKPTPPLSHAEIWQILPTFFGIDLLVYITTVAMVIGVERYSETRFSAAEEDRLREELLRAELSILERRIRPRFLLRALGALERLIHEDRTKADELVSRLSHFLRASLRDGVSDVGSELELLDDFLAIESLTSGRDVMLESDVAASIVSSEVPPLFITHFVDAAWPDDGLPVAVHIRGGDDQALRITIEGPHRSAREVRALLPLREELPPKLTESEATLQLELQLAAAVAR